jgi:hypothetical protein
MQSIFLPLKLLLDAPGIYILAIPLLFLSVIAALVFFIIWIIRKKR